MEITAWCLTGVVIAQTVLIWWLRILISQLDRHGNESARKLNRKAIFLEEKIEKRIL
ncbi:hypothetical protein [Stenoxybacter acetivorans]|uniref:hypothetical protein n=1 Tax=Stenoxybacter acetivorans TaxID=422441 RepID=UPI0012EB924B|nr:hypothetical protein [Stenoxybacter acetivorans]